MKTDIELQRDVLDELAFEPSVDAAEIGVSVTNGVVALNGTVKSYAEKIAAEVATRRVGGVKAIAEELKVRLPDQPKIADHEIAQRLLDIFEWDITIPNERIKVKVEHGWVTLTGTVGWYFQRDAAAKAAAKIGGVVGVSNLIEIGSSSMAADVRGRIKAAIKRAANLDADSISVRAEGGKVTLSGHVHGWHERQAAERAAWGAAGVTKVEDNIVITA